MSFENEDLETQRILVVEGKPHLHDVVVSHLASRGPWISVLRDSSRGFDRVREDDPDLVIVDLTYHASGALELCRRLQADPATRAVPLVMVSGLTTETSVVKDLESDAGDGICRHVRPWELLNEIDGILVRGSVEA